MGLGKQTRALHYTWSGDNQINCARYCCGMNKQCIIDTALLHYASPLAKLYVNLWHTGHQGEVYVQDPVSLIQRSTLLMFWLQNNWQGLWKWFNRTKSWQECRGLHRWRHVIYLVWGVLRARENTVWFMYPSVLYFYKTYNKRTIQNPQRS